MMSGCEKNPSDDPVSGGVIDHSDPSASKEIKSKELVSMETGFYRYAVAYREADIKAKLAN